jgi:adenylate kinase
VILLMGIAGAGKGTQGTLLAEKQGYTLISMGDVVRAKVSDEQKARMLNGDLLRDDEVTAMIDQTLAELANPNQVILDGYPRTIAQAEWLVAQAQAGRFDLHTAIHLVASRAAVKERLLGRARVDDNEAAIEKRFDEYERATAPIIDWLNTHGVIVRNIDAERSVEAIHQDLVQHLQVA